MNEGIYIAASAGNKQLQNLDVISNNLANVNSTGFKKDQLVFEAMMPPFGEDLTFEASRNAVLPASLSNQDVAYVAVAGVSTTLTQGSMLKTDNPLDVALEGKGFFEVKTPRGIRYTRQGSFRIDAQNRLVTQDGNPIMGEGRETIEIDASLGGSVTIDNAGLVSLGNSRENIPIIRLKVTDFRNRSLLVKEGNGLFQLLDPNDRGFTPVSTRVRQGFVEGSNVKVMEEMTKMIQTLRAFEAYQTVIQSIDRVDNQSINTLGRVV